MAQSSKFMFSGYCPDGWYAGKSRCYRLAEGEVDQAGADAACNALLEGSRTAEPLNDVAHQEILTLFKQSSSSGKWLGIKNEQNEALATKMWQYTASGVPIMDFHYSHWAKTHESEAGECVQAKVEEEELVWSKAACTDKATGVVCERMFDWRKVGQCYGQPSSERTADNESDLTAGTEDRIKVCAETCKQYWYFDVDSEKSKCHCINNVPLGGTVQTYALRKWYKMIGYFVHRNGSRGGM